MVSKPLKVYGDPARLRDVIRRAIRRGNGLLSEAYSVRDILESDLKNITPGTNGFALAVLMMRSSSALRQFQELITKWDKSLHQSTTKMLGSQAEQFFIHKRVVSKIGLPRNQKEILADEESHVNGRIAELERMLKRIPIAIPEGVTTEIRPFEDLRRSALIEEVQLNEYLKRMAVFRTKQQISAAIGAAKELVEATLHSALYQMVPDERPSHDFMKLGKQVRRHLDSRFALVDQSLTAEPTTEMLSGLISIENSLASLRNNVGTGHGRSHLPSYLSARHALLARDVAFTYTRYLVLALVEARVLTLSETE